MAEPTLGRRLKELRMERRLSLRAVGRRVEIAAAHLLGIERDRWRPSAGVLEALARLYEVPIGSLRRLDRSAPITEIRDACRRDPDLAPLLRRVIARGLLSAARVRESFGLDATK